MCVCRDICCGICYIVMTCGEIKFSKTCVYSFYSEFLLGLFIRVTLANKMIAIHILMMMSCCAE